MDNVTFRVATISDAEELLAIYAPYVRNTAITFEYDVPTVAEFAGRIADVLARFPYLVAVKDGQIIGYSYAHPFHPRAAFAWAVEMTIYLKPNARHAGLGRALYTKMEEILAAQGVRNVTAAVASTDQPDEHLTNASVLFHHKMGYHTVGVFTCSGYKFNTWYDLMWLEKWIGSHEKNMQPIRTFEEVRAQFGL